MPVAMISAYTHRSTGEAIAVEGSSVPYMMANGAYIGFFAMSGHPVVVIPTGCTAEGLLIGMQIVGQRWQEMKLLAIAQWIDEVIDAYQRPAGYE